MQCEKLTDCNSLINTGVYASQIHICNWPQFRDENVASCKKHLHYIKDKFTNISN